VLTRRRLWTVVSSRMIAQANTCPAHLGSIPFRDMTILHPEVTVHIRSDRRQHLPYGLDGGATGTPSSNVLRTDPDREQILPAKVVRTLTAGDRHRHVTAGGGGHGDPFTRDPVRVLQDVLDGKVTITGAARDYGVVITPEGTVDTLAPHERRTTARRRTPSDSPIEPGPARHQGPGSTEALRHG
jgi:N-methylhydantoinase B